MTMRSNTLLLAALTISLAGCASASKTANAGGGSGVTADPNRITADEIAKADVSTAYDAVYSLHRSWFRDMSAGASGEVFVYVDNRALDDGKEGLRQIPANQVASIQYLKSADAVLRFGPRGQGGAIIVTRK